MRIYRWLLRLSPVACGARTARQWKRCSRAAWPRRAAGLWRDAHLWWRELTGVLAARRVGTLGRGAAKASPAARKITRGRRASWIRITQEIRQAARRLVRTAFTLAAALTLALAIGANASIFAVVQRVVLNPLPYPDSDRLIASTWHPARNMASGLTRWPGALLPLVDRARTLERWRFTRGSR